MLTKLRELIPGTEHWTAFVVNTSQQFEARHSTVTIQNPEPSVFDGIVDRHCLSLYPMTKAELSSPHQLSCSHSTVVG